MDDIPEPPPCPPKLKEYLKLLAKAAMTARPIAGRNVTINKQEGKGTTIDARDCVTT